MTGTTIDRTAAGGRPRSDPWLSTWPLSRYDLVLALIPLALGLAILAATLLEIAVPTALAGASALCLGLIVDTVYRNPPVPTS